MDGKNSSQHYKRCKVCSTDFDHDVHSGGTWYAGQGDANTETDKHYKNCSVCGELAYVWGWCNKNTKEQISSNVNEHNTYCDVCNRYMNTENHYWSGGEDAIHKCSECGYDHGTFRIWSRRITTTSRGYSDG